MSGSRPAAPKSLPLGAAAASQLDAMARLAREGNVVVHVVVPREPGVVERARETARQFGLECYADIRLRSIRVRFTP